ncbi:MAG: peptidyl-prolyl cis-trans isomerase [Nannocystaceae bacterium]|nr:peptidyl-prolyl cis-trans isomerase [Nannocystaceae bacterium]
MAAASCDVSEGIPEGKLAVVGPTVLGPEDVAAARSQVGKYGQLRFAGPEGEATMLETLVAVELMALEAEEAGLGSDPRVAFALQEEISAVYLSTLLERAVPRDSVASDSAALRAYYDAHPAAFTLPQKRSAQGVVFKTFAEADQALAALQGGTSELSDLGDVFATPMQARDDTEYPGFHPYLFEEGVAVGDFLTQPVFLGESLLIGRLQKVASARLRPFDDAAVQERLVEAVIKPRREAARQAIVERLAQGQPPL